jgi:hypothetical protein
LTPPVSFEPLLSLVSATRASEPLLSFEPLEPLGSLSPISPWSSQSHVALEPWNSAVAHFAPVSCETLVSCETCETCETCEALSPCRAFAALSPP